MERAKTTEHVLVVFNNKQVIIDSFKHCTLTVGRRSQCTLTDVTDVTDDVTDETNQPCAADLGLYYAVNQERQESSEGLTHTYITKINVPGLLLNLK